jgi:sterol desaturase/sphingolipid hydroxylase (fatty acid hydroxylase superfamily)
MLLVVLIAIAGGFFVVERLWPANALPRVRAWWPRVIFVNVIQVGIILLAGLTWDRWLQDVSIFSLREAFGESRGGLLAQGLIAYFVSTFVYYWWHRWRHESKFFWRLCHQLHHSPARIELVTSFYKHPVEITLNSLLSAGILYTLLGCSPVAGAVYTFLTAVAEYFYHWNIRTPHWLGRLVQRPESHRVHHQFNHHTHNYADLPLWDALFGTYRNPLTSPSRCGYEDWREDRFDDILAFRDVHTSGADKLAPLHLLPTCIGCAKRWACAESRGVLDSAPANEANPDPQTKNRDAHSGSGNGVGV